MLISYKQWLFHERSSLVNLWNNDETWLETDDTIDNDAAEVIDYNTSSNVVYDNDILTCNFLV